MGRDGGSPSSVSVDRHLEKAISLVDHFCLAGERFYKRCDDRQNPDLRVAASISDLRRWMKVQEAQKKKKKD